MRHIHRYRSLAWLVLFVFMFTLVPVLPGQAADEIKITDIKNAYGFRDVTGGTTVIIEGTGFGQEHGEVSFLIGGERPPKSRPRFRGWSDRQVTVAAPVLPDRS
ncbi:MAG: IPT/TIG domain-containing protein [Syntrophothermaceae bacterium]